MDKWRHIFMDEGESASREKILSGLMLEQVIYLPSKTSHSIYDELWHITRWQHIYSSDDEAASRAWQRGERYPAQPPTSEQAWHELVKEFFEGLETVLTWTTSAEKLAIEPEPGLTLADALVSLAVHNAYHFGKIVTLWQMIGIWPQAK
jgi:uncharacterized damage-inducible protein DinB